jgi:hypothetical protein
MVLTFCNLHYNLCDAIEKDLDRRWCNGYTTFLWLASLIHASADKALLFLGDILAWDDGQEGVYKDD